ncbi:MAG: hypothetical protein IPN06_17575 [Burkholderiales bacterium]|nr:hypothetical protein [Burkholderiales bacterium]
MACVLHISAAGNVWWGKKSTGWEVLPAPGAGPVWVLTDLTEEAFTEITVPRVFGRDRSSFVERQLASRFPETRFRVALDVQRHGSLMNRLAPPHQVLTAVEPADRITAALQDLSLPLAGVWSTSMLLARLGSKPRMPANLLIVLCQPGGMRIVFIKDRAPVLTRLVAAQQSAADQAVEILRTLRHLENTRTIERGRQRFAALLLGAAQGLEPILAADRLDALDASVLRKNATERDWRPLLLDMVCKSPPGQMAPVALRERYLALQVVRAARVASGLFLAATGAVVLGHVSTITGDHRERTQLMVNLAQLDAQIAEVDAAIQAYGVAPELLRQALAVDSAEITQAPDMAADWVDLSRVLSTVPGARLKNLQWRLLEPGTSACPAAGDAPPQTDVPVDAPPPTAPVRVVELHLQVVLAADTGPRQKLQQAQQISTGLAALEGVKVVHDPALRLRDGDLSAGGAQQGGENDLAWCAALTRTPPHSAVPTGVAP